MLTCVHVGTHRSWLVRLTGTPYYTQESDHTYSTEGRHRSIRLRAYFSGAIDFNHQFHAAPRRWKDQGKTQQRIPGCAGRKLLCLATRTIGQLSICAPSLSGSPNTSGGRHVEHLYIMEN